jgi:hypothetical protein
MVGALSNRTNNRAALSPRTFGECSWEANRDIEAAVPASNERSAHSFPVVRQVGEQTQAALRSEPSPSEYGTLSAWLRTDAKDLPHGVPSIFLSYINWIGGLRGGSRWANPAILGHGSNENNEI